MALKKLPAHLKRYVVDQNYQRYTPEDQAVWRYVMRRLTHFMKTNAHPCYMDGLKKTGISIDVIPKIDEMNLKLSEFGWGAIPVSGFIPPAAFMEFQSLGFLPIASDMRTLEHLLYTPAPDIVHEAAGHAPILIDPAFAKYLKSYADVAKNAIISKEDLAQYEAIRILSDLKEDPNSTSEQIKEANLNLEKANQAISYVSEASFLSRMNWWTAEYGLIGTLDNPKIFGAGLLSSVGESKECLNSKVKKIPLTIHCVDYTYDITEPQPQLFVTPDFETLESVLMELSKRLAYKQGGLIGLEKAQIAKTVNTIELNSGVQISGTLEYYKTNQVAGLVEPIFIKTTGPTQLSYQKNEIEGQGCDHHFNGYSCPIGYLKNISKCLSEFNRYDLKQNSLNEGSEIRLEYASGILLTGVLDCIVWNKKGTTEEKPIIFKISNCNIKYKNEILYQADWGPFDLALGSSIPSVFGGPADRMKYGEVDDFVSSRVPEKKFSDYQLKVFEQYNQIRNIRNSNNWSKIEEDKLIQLIDNYLEIYKKDWLIGVELLELTNKHKLTKQSDKLIFALKDFALNTSNQCECILDGIDLATRVI